MKTKSKRKKSVTTKNTRNNVTSYCINIINLYEEIDKLNELIDEDEFPYEENRNKIYSMCDFFIDNKITPPEKLRNLIIKLNEYTLISEYKRDKANFFIQIENEFNIHFEIITKRLSTVKNYFDKEDAEKIEAMIAAKKYNL